jgi:hypothetical protein
MVKPLLDRFGEMVNFIYVENTGPYRKIVPYLSNHFSGCAPVERLFVTVDDDTIYPDSCMGDLLDAYDQNKCVVAFRGRRISLHEKSIADYSQWGKGVSKPLFSNIPTGKDGVLYSTRFFDIDFLNMAAALKLAPTADDLWIKWHTSMAGIKSYIINPAACESDYKSFPLVDYSSDARANTLYSTHNRDAAGGKNNLSVKNLEDYFQSNGLTLRDILMVLS